MADILATSANIGFWKVLGTIVIIVLFVMAFTRGSSKKNTSGKNTSNNHDTDGGSK